jgi:ribosomal-protein-alanine N-acetyltransferase
VADRFSLQPLGALDLDRAAAIHREAFSALGERGWTRRDFGGLLSSPGVGGFLLVADNDDAGLALWRTVADEAELLTIAVRAPWRRAGGGRVLLHAAIERIKGAGVHSLFLEVAADNPPALALYEKTGFQAVGGRPAYYRRDALPAAGAIVMRLAIR